MGDNPVFDLQQRYLQELESKYQDKQSEKKAKKLVILRSIKKIQKFWRFFARMKKLIASNKIGSWFKLILEKRRQLKTAASFLDKEKMLHVF